MKRISFILGLYAVLFSQTGSAQAFIPSNSSTNISNLQIYNGNPNAVSVEGSLELNGYLVIRRLGRWVYEQIGNGPGCNGFIGNWNANGLPYCAVGDTTTFPANCYYVAGASRQQYRITCR